MAQIGTQQLPVKYPIALAAGDDFRLTLTATESAVPYAWGTVVAAIVGHSTVTAFTVSLPSNGTAILSLTEAQTTALGPGGYTWSFTATKADYSQTWMGGTLTVTPPGTPGTSQVSATVTVTTGATTSITVSSSAASSAVIASSATAIEVFSTTAETDLISLTIPAGSVAAGDVLEVVYSGDVLNNTGNNTRTFNPRLYLGSTLVFGNLASAAMTSSSSRRKWVLRAQIFVTSLTTQQVSVTMSVSDPATGTSAGQAFAMTGWTTAAVDLSVNQTVKMSVNVSSSGINHRFENKYAVVKRGKA